MQKIFLVFKISYRAILISILAYSRIPDKDCAILRGGIKGGKNFILAEVWGFWKVRDMEIFALLFTFLKNKILKNWSSASNFTV